MLLVVNFIYIYKVDKYLENLLFNDLGVPKSKQSVSQKEIMLCFTVFKTGNRFSKLNSSSLHLRFISDCRNSTIFDRRNTADVGVRQHPVVGILQMPESGDI
jgi:hypothetical protein